MPRRLLPGVCCAAAVLAGCSGPPGAHPPATARNAPAAGDEVAAPAGRTAEELLSSLPPARIDPADHAKVRELGGASAPRLMFVAMIPLLSAGAVGEEAPEHHCPSVAREGEVTTIRGGCTSEEGTSWTGEAVIRGMDARARTGAVTYRGFGFHRRVECEGGPRDSEWQANGRFSSERDGEGIRFAIDLAFEGQGVDEQCRPMLGTGAVRYEGRQTRVGNAVRWNGRGRYGWEGFGVVEAVTEDELVNQANCRSEALMGTTTVRGAEHTVVFRYDGETDCDEESTAEWSFDGEPQGELAGVGCDAAGGARGGWWVVLLALASLFRPSSRGRPSPSSRSA